MFDKRKSTEIYHQLMNGKVINKHKIVNDGTRAENALYSEIIENLDDYSKQYIMAGYEFIGLEGLPYFYIREAGTEYISDLDRKVYILLLIVFRYVSQKYSMDKLTHEAGGLSTFDLEEIDNDESFKELAHKAQIGVSPISKGIEINLVNKNFMLAKPTGELLLSDVGQAYLDEVKSIYSNIEIDNY
ncbi:hypothetical protein FGD67_21300 [Colwellia sp. M166]|uniref:condensin complex protein MksE n=1 Tax=Colwellia sp. M166 TaxID=2583805 RepID=UPI00211EE43E|nr:hypothetical protein [Colwellia sp. M166]UUO25469.1 hypothetical protein FGD67_21300 [Colwellia sp. M166]